MKPRSRLSFFWMNGNLECVPSLEIWNVHVCYTTIYGGSSRWKTLSEPGPCRYKFAQNAPISPMGTCQGPYLTASCGGHGRHGHWRASPAIRALAWRDLFQHSIKRLDWPSRVLPDTPNNVIILETESNLNSQGLISMLRLASRNQSSFWLEHIYRQWRRLRHHVKLHRMHNSFGLFSYTEA